MKKLQKFIAVKLSFLIVLMTTMSCSKNDLITSTSNEKLVVQAKENSKKVVDLFLSVKKSVESKASSRSIEDDLTQEQIDQYLVESGLNAGDVSLQTVLTMVNYLNENSDLTFNERVNEMNFSNFAKTKLIEMNNNGVIANLPSQTGFQNLT